MISLTVSKFKATCLAVIDRVQKTGESVLITKHGKPAAVLGPPKEEAKPRKTHFGMFKDEITFIGDVITPLGTDDWEVLKD